MDWLSKYHAHILCDEKIVRVPYDKGVLNIPGDRKDSRGPSRLAVISCTKIPKLIEKGCYLFLAQVSEKGGEAEEEKRVEDVSVIREFPDVFPDDLPGIPPTRQVEFQIELIPGAAPVA